MLSETPGFCRRKRDIDGVLRILNDARQLHVAAAGEAAARDGRALELERDDAHQAPGLEDLDAAVGLADGAQHEALVAVELRAAAQLVGGRGAVPVADLAALVRHLDAQHDRRLDAGVAREHVIAQVGQHAPLNGAAELLVKADARIEVKGPRAQALAKGLLDILRAPPPPTTSDPSSLNSRPSPSRSIRPEQHNVPRPFLGRHGVRDCSHVLGSAQHLLGRRRPRTSSAPAAGPARRPQGPRHTNECTVAITNARRLSSTT